MAMRAGTPIRKVNRGRKARGNLKGRGRKGKEAQRHEQVLEMETAEVPEHGNKRRKRGKDAPAERDDR